MKGTIKKIALLALVFNSHCTFSQELHELYGISFFSPRSFNTNVARQMVGIHPYINRTDAKKCYGVFSATPEYLHSYKTRRVAEVFFGTDTLRFSGSLVNSRSEDDILADYFGMSPTFDSLMTVDPKVRTFLIDFDLYVGFDGFCPGLYIRAHAPAAWTQWQLKLCEDITNNGADTQYPADYMAAAAINAPAQSAIVPFRGMTTYGHVTEGMKYGKIDGCQDQGKLADFQFAVGYNFIRRERGHFGANLFFVAPTGTRPTSEYLFEPIVGNGRHWELGIGLTGGILLWEKDGDKTISAKVDVDFTHLFKSCQHRSFDFTKNGFGSRFILLKEFDSAGAYTGTCLPAINKTTLPCNVWVSFQMDAALLISYHSKHWTIDLGYNGWIRSREKICITGEIEANKYSLKGIQNVTGAGANNTQSTAKLHGNELDAVVQAQVADNPSPVFIKTSDLDLCSATMPRSISHKFFWNISYAWDTDDNRWTIPFLGIGGEVEFEGVNICRVEPNKNTMSTFGFWLKGGLVF